MYSKNKHTFMI